MIDYRELYHKFRERLASNEELKTAEITRRIKDFFRHEFAGHFVAPADGVKEFLVDVFVSNRNPRAFSNESGASEFRAILAVESELGGEGAGSPQYLMRNVLEDFAKLLVVQCDYKVLIFTSLPYAREEDHLDGRLRDIRSMHSSAGHPGNILLIHLRSSPQRTQNGNPTNPKVSLCREGMSAYVLSRGMDVQKLA